MASGVYGLASTYLQEPRFKGKTAIVTGGAQGIGRATALRLAQEGAALVVADQNVEAAERVRDEILTLGSRAVGVAVDVREDCCGSRLVTEVLASYPRVDLAVFCAGVTGMRNWTEVSAAEWDGIINVNLRGTFLCLQAVARQMIAQGGPGAMVTLAATSGHGPRPDAVPYGASKAGVIHLTRSAALGLARFGIRVNAISPGIVETQMWEGVVRDRSGMQGVNPKAYEATALANVPLGRASKPEEIAGLAAFLLSEEAAYITGQVIIQDGGYSLKVA